MGDCCSTNASKTIDASALPEGQPIIKSQDTDDVINYHPGVLKDRTGKRGETSKSSKTKKVELPIEEQWKNAVIDNNNKKLKSLYQKHRKQINFATIIFENGDTSLHYAARTGNKKLVQFLLLVKSDVSLLYIYNK